MVFPTIPTMFSGQDVTLIIPVDSSQVDEFNVPIQADPTEVVVKNVLIKPANSDDKLSNTDPNGKTISYVLSIPKTDDHDWNNCFVSFYGRTWHVVGVPIIYDQNLTPLDWNKEVTVEAYE